MPAKPNPTIRLYLATLPADMQGERERFAKEIFPSGARMGTASGLPGARCAW